jgi:hypothetical protein
LRYDHSCPVQEPGKSLENDAASSFPAQAFGCGFGYRAQDIDETLLRAGRGLRPHVVRAGGFLEILKGPACFFQVAKPHILGNLLLRFVAIVGDDVRLKTRRPADDNHISQPSGFLVVLIQLEDSGDDDDAFLVGLARIFSLDREIGWQDLAVRVEQERQSIKHRALAAVVPAGQDARLLQRDGPHVGERPEARD